MNSVMVIDDALHMQEKLEKQRLEWLKTKIVDLVLSDPRICVVSKTRDEIIDLTEMFLSRIEDIIQWEEYVELPKKIQLGYPSWDTSFIALHIDSINDRIWELLLHREQKLEIVVLETDKMIVTSWIMSNYDLPWTLMASIVKSFDFKEPPLPYLPEYKYPWKVHDDEPRRSQIKRTNRSMPKNLRK